VAAVAAGDVDVDVRIMAITIKSMFLREPITYIWEKTVLLNTLKMTVEPL